MRVFDISCLTHFVEPEMFVLSTIPLSFSACNWNPSHRNQQLPYEPIKAISMVTWGVAFAYAYIVKQKKIFSEALSLAKRSKDCPCLCKQVRYKNRILLFRLIVWVVNDILKN